MSVRIKDITGQSGSPLSDNIAGSGRTNEPRVGSRKHLEPFDALQTAPSDN